MNEISGSRTIDVVRVIAIQDPLEAESLELLVRNKTFCRRITQDDH